MNEHDGALAAAGLALKAGALRCADEAIFSADALNMFRAARLASMLEAPVAPEALALGAALDATDLAGEAVFEVLSQTLLEARQPSLFFRALLDMDHLKEFFPELLACVGVPQNPVYHPEGDVFEHTMRVVDCAAGLRERAAQPLGFMLSALLHDLGKTVATQVQPDGKITSYGHELQGLPLCEAQLRRLTDREDLIEYVKNQSWLHMRPNILADCRSKKRKTRLMFDMSACPEDLILLSRADASGKEDSPYDEANEAFLRLRLEDYRQMLARPMVTAEDLIAAGVVPGPDLDLLLERARRLHFSGLERERALKQALAEMGKK